MRQVAPGADQRARSLAAIVRLLGDCYALWPLVLEADRTPDVEKPERNIIAGGHIQEVDNRGQLYQGLRNHSGGKKYEHGDSTANAALGYRATKQWLDDFDKALNAISALASKGRELVGSPLAVCPAGDCGKPILDDDRTETFQGRTWHERCRRRARRLTG